MESSILSLQNNLYKHYMDEFGKEDESFRNQYIPFEDYKNMVAKDGRALTDQYCHRQLDMIHQEKYRENEYVNNVISEISHMYEQDKLYGSEPIFQDELTTYEAAEEKLKEAIKRGVSPENQIKIAEAMEDRALPAKDVVAYAKEDVVKEYIEEAQEKIYFTEFGVREGNVLVENERYDYDDFKIDIEKGGMQQALTHGHEKLNEHDRTELRFQKLMERIKVEKSNSIKESKNMAAAMEFEKPINDANEKEDEIIESIVSRVSADKIVKIDKNSFKRRMNQLGKETHRPMERLAPISKSKEMEVGE